MKSLAVVFTLLTLLAAGAIPDPLKADDKVVICHVNPGNPSQATTIRVGTKSADKHLANHSQDSEGHCPITNFCQEAAVDECLIINSCTLSSCSGGPRPTLISIACPNIPQCQAAFICLEEIRGRITYEAGFCQFF